MGSTEWKQAVRGQSVGDVRRQTIAVRYPAKPETEVRSIGVGCCLDGDVAASDVPEPSNQGEHRSLDWRGQGCTRIVGKHETG